MNQKRMLNNGDSMNKDLSNLATAISITLNDLYGENMGFALLCFRFSNVGVCDYVSNAQREDMIRSLREAANRLEMKEDIPMTIGNA